MFCLCRSEYSEGVHRSRNIDKEISREKMLTKRLVKVLLLGAGETGKTTFAKQMRILYGEKYSKEDLLEFRKEIHYNILKAMKVLVDARRKLAIKWENERNEKKAERLLEWSIPKKVDYNIFKDCVELVCSLWEDNSIKIAFDRRREFQLPDSTKYFMERLAAISEQDYLPSCEDLLRSRKISRGITEYHAQVSRVPFMFVDVGGQRHYRQKWIACFENVTTVLFFVSASEFDEVLAEDRSMNRLQESVKLFGDIANSAWFTRSNIILFFNKMDQFREKIQYSDIRDHFPEFKGDGKDEAQVKKYLFTIFERERMDHTRTLFHHYTTAIDTNNIRYVFDDVQEIILQNNLMNHILL